MDRMSGTGMEFLLYQYFEKDILKYTGEKFEEFYSKPKWFTKMMVEQITKYEAAQKKLNTPPSGSGL